MKEERHTIAYIDGQNLHLATTKHPMLPWRIDLTRFRVYLREKYHVQDAYYWLGYVGNDHDELYDEKRASSLYKTVDNRHYDDFSKFDIREKIGSRKRERGG